VVSHHNWVSRVVGNHGHGFSIQVVDPEHCNTVVSDSRRISAYQDSTVSAKFLAIDRDGSLTAPSANTGRLELAICHSGQSGKLTHQIGNVGVQGGNIFGFTSYVMDSP